MEAVKNTIFVALKQQTKIITLKGKEEIFELDLQPNIKKLLAIDRLPTADKKERLCKEEAERVYNQLKTLKML